MKTVTINEFKNTLQAASPMPLFQKNETSSYKYFKILGEKLTESLKNGTSPFLPNDKGYIDLSPAYNINTNTKLEGLTQLVLQTKKAELKAPSSAFVTFETIKKAQDSGVNCKIIKGSKGIVIPIVDENNWEHIKFKNTWFNIAQLENAQNLIDWCKDRITEQYVKDVYYINEHYPSSTYKEKKNPANFVFDKPNEKIIPLNDKTEEPFQYLAQVLNALQNSKKLFVPKDKADIFKTKTIKLLTAEYKPGCLDVCAIKKLSNSAESLYKKNKKNSPEKKRIIQAKKQKESLNKKYYCKER